MRKEEVWREALDKIDAERFDTAFASEDVMQYMDLESARAQYPRRSWCRVALDWVRRLL